MKHFYIVYLTTNTVNGKKYIGVHKCKKLNDGYIGSGHAMKAAIKKYGKASFVREVLFTFDNPEDAYNKEAELVNESIVHDSQFYNLVSGGTNRLHISEETRKKLSKNNKGKKRKAGDAGIVKVTAINLRTGERKEYDSILSCSQDLKLAYAAVLKVCKRRYNMTKVFDWTFETEKYGKALPAKVNPTPGIAKNKRGYIVWDGRKYVGFKKTLEDALELQKEYKKNKSCEA